MYLQLQCCFKNKFTVKCEAILLNEKLVQEKIFLHILHLIVQVYIYMCVLISPSNHILQNLRRYALYSDDSLEFVRIIAFGGRRDAETYLGTCPMLSDRILYGTTENWNLSSRY